MQSFVAHTTTEQSRVPSGHSKSKSKEGLESVVGTTATWRDRAWEYPTPPCEGVVEDLHGCQVRDPYRSFEVLEADKTQQYMKEQNEVSPP